MGCRRVTFFIFNEKYFNYITCSDPSAGATISVSPHWLFAHLCKRKHLNLIDFYLQRCRDCIMLMWLVHIQARLIKWNILEWSRCSRLHQSPWNMYDWNFSVVSCNFSIFCFIITFAFAAWITHHLIIIPSSLHGWQCLKCLEAASLRLSVWFWSFQNQSVHYCTVV